MGFLDSSSGRSILTGGFGGQLFARCLSTGGFASGLLGASHFDRGDFSKTEDRKQSIGKVVGIWSDDGR